MAENPRKIAVSGLSEGESSGTFLLGAVLMSGFCSSTAGPQHPKICQLPPFSGTRLRTDQDRLCAKRARPDEAVDGRKGSATGNGGCSKTDQGAATL
jgi:hypothetical protein